MNSHLNDAKLQRPVFIIGCHKSGSSFLRALLDGHPGLAVVPTETHFFEVLGRGIQYPLWHHPPHRPSLEGVQDRLLRAAGRFSRTTDPYSDAPGFAGYDMQRISRRVRALESTSAPYLLGEYLEMLYEASHGGPPSGRLVEKSVENAEFLSALDAITHQARFVAIVRNPYANLVAMRRHRSHATRSYPRLRPLAESLVSFHYALLRARIHHENLLVIRYEDLVTDTRAVMTEIVDFLEEAWDDALLSTSTLGGQDWVSNSTWGTDAAISRRSLHSWEGDVRPLEIAAVDLFLAGICEEYGYDEATSPSAVSTLLPARRELPPTWLVNRIDVALQWARRSGPSPTSPPSTA